jgi:hypothetical protein
MDLQIFGMCFPYGFFEIFIIDKIEVIEEWEMKSQMKYSINRLINFLIESTNNDVYCILC